MAIPVDASYSTLRVEFETNNLYSPAYANGDNNTVCLLSNAIASPQYLMDVAQVDARQVQSVVDTVEWDALLPEQRDHWRDMINSSIQEGFIVRDQGFRDQVLAIWGPGTDTRAAFALLQQRDATEFEAFWDNLTFVFDTLSCTVEDVRLARATA